ncbi:MAG: alpha-amylase [Oscillochloris sp.]|nr:alpha-amylase [Oscillochloris sp.]
MLRLLIRFLLLLFVLSACTAPVAQAPTNPAATATTSATPAAATVAPAPSPTSDPRLPTAPPRITPGPTAAPAPIAAGWWDGSVCYEIFVRSFYDSDGDGIGDLNGVIEKLDYVNDGDTNSRRDLGADCIWLMPIAESTSYHGYDVTDYYTVEADYGTNEDFKRLVAEAEQRGIKIIIDLVLNHTSVEHPWFQQALGDPKSPYRDWYLWSEIRPNYRGPFNNEVWHQSPLGDEFYYGLFWSGMPDLNYRNPAVTEFAEEVSRFWVEEMGAAGFRLDAIKHLIEYQAAQSDTAETHNWLREYRQFLERDLPGTFTVGEIFDGGPRTLPNYYPDQLDFYFEFEIARNTRGAADLGLGRGYLDAVTAAMETLPFQRFSPFLTNHDQNRVMSELDDDIDKAKLAALALLTLPGMPFVYYGEEIGMLGVKPDERIRTPMQWTSEGGGGFTSGEPWQALQEDYVVKHVAQQDEDPNSLLNTYRELIHLHRATAALATGDFVALESDNSSVAAFIRRTGDEAVLVLINFEDAPAATPLLSSAGSGLSAGAYTLRPLYGEATAEILTVGDAGAITDYTPLAEIPARTGYIFGLTR